MSECLDIDSHKGIYSVSFGREWLSTINSAALDDLHFIVDSKVAELYWRQLNRVLGDPKTILIDATENNKSIEAIIPIFQKLIANNARRSHELVAIGGGVIQDITCFIATVFLRGVNWRFYPTTLLAQADSCIGSKSSINLGKTKNILGTFNPPKEIYICSEFLDTLEDKEMRSGIGEILKVHAIDSVESFDLLANHYDDLISNRLLLSEYINRSLSIKKKFIEVDEFDKGIRNIFNYGHSFGHAIESASKYLIPHGVAVSMGMDMANRIAVLRNLISVDHYHRMHKVLRKNYEIFAKTPMDLDEIISALTKDKKNTTTQLSLIFPVGDKANIEKVNLTLDDSFRSQCQVFLEEMKHE